MNQKQRSHVKALQRREQHLATRIASLPDDVTSLPYDKGERAALRWALAVIEQVDEMQMLRQLELTSPVEADSSTA